MRGYHRIVSWVIGIWILLMVAGTVYLSNSYQKSNGKPYQVEMNRIGYTYSNADLEKIQSQEIDLEKYQYVIDVRYLAADDPESELVAFLEATTGKKETEYIIRPVIARERIVGYLRYEVLIWKVYSNRPIIRLWLITITLIMVAIGVLLYYIKREIMQPFKKLTDMPYDLAKGRLKSEVKESKYRYFGKFLWGINMLRETLEKHKQREMQLEKEKKTLLVSLAHDIKTPLSMIMLYAQALKEKLYDTEEKKEEAIDQILGKANAIENYVSEIIHVSKNDIFNLEVEEETFYLNEIIDSIRDSYDEKCKRRYIDFTIEAYENKLLIGDSSKLIEVLENVMENAIKYGDKESIKITCYEEDYCQLINITNSGKPIPSTDFVHMFESFWRGKNAHEKQGYGLGLYICKSIMHQMKGEIFVENTQESMSLVIVVRKV
nr:HAMP domain-containing sensor histidine kinase [uncultured Anaerosporobacter sp.]